VLARLLSAVRFVGRQLTFVIEGHSLEAKANRCMLPQRGVNMEHSQRAVAVND
jgi:hypothetical protein